jgi:hypothetical protein
MEVRAVPFRKALRQAMDIALEVPLWLLGLSPNFYSKGMVKFIL